MLKNISQILYSGYVRVTNTNLQVMVGLIENGCQPRSLHWISNFIFFQNINRLKNARILTKDSMNICFFFDKNLHNVLP